MPCKGQVAQGMKREVILENASKPPPFLFTSWFSSACHSNHVSTAKELLWEANHKTNRCREHAAAAMFFKKNKLQVSHLTSTTKSWGGRNCYKNVSQQAPIPTVVWWCFVFFLTHHTFHAGSLSVCVYVFACTCAFVFWGFLIHFAKFLTGFSNERSTTGRQNLLSSSYYFKLHFVSCLGTLWPQLSYLLLLPFFFIIITII